MSYSLNNESREYLTFGDRSPPSNLRFRPDSSNHSKIEQMLSVQRQIQESQIRNTDNIARLENQTQENSRLIRENGRLIQELARDTRQDLEILVEEISKLTVDQREKFNQFYGYHCVRRFRTAEYYGEIE